MRCERTQLEEKYWAFSKQQHFFHSYNLSVCVCACVCLCSHCSGASSTLCGCIVVVRVWRVCVRVLCTRQDCTRCVCDRRKDEYGVCIACVCVLSKAGNQARRD